MKRLRAGGIYQDAAEGRGAGSSMREDSQPTRCRGAAANALLISATEKIPPTPCVHFHPLLFVSWPGL